MTSLLHYVNMSIGSVSNMTSLYHYVYMGIGNATNMTSLYHYVYMDIGSVPNMMLLYHYVYMDIGSVPKRRVFFFSQFTWGSFGFVCHVSHVAFRGSHFSPFLTMLTQSKYYCVVKNSLKFHQTRDFGQLLP